MSEEITPEMTRAVKDDPDAFIMNTGIAIYTGPGTQPYRMDNYVVCRIKGFSDLIKPTNASG